MFAHVPLVIGEDGRRLAKRHGDTRLSLWREAGVGPERLLGFLAQASGLRPTSAPVSAAELCGDFDWAAIPRTPLVFTSAMLQALLPA
jgi:glutamyl-tRNA synthetase